MSVTLSDIAKKAHVDVSTVSRAINNSGYVAPETKKRIFEVIDELSYEPNLIVKNIRIGKRRTIGVVVPTLSLSVFGDLIKSISKKAYELNYEIMLCVTHENPKIEEGVINRLSNGLIDGLLIAGTGRNKTLIRDLVVRGIPVIQIIRDQIPEIPAVKANYKKTATDAVKFLANKGCTSIALINSEKMIGPFEDRLEGYKIGMRAMRLPRILPEKKIKDFKSYYEEGYRQTNSLLNYSLQEIDGILVATDEMALGVFRAIKDNGLSVPWDIRVMSLTGHSIGEMLETTMTAMEIPVTDIGNKSIERLIDIVENKKEMNNEKIEFKSKLVERESTN